MQLGIACGGGQTLTARAPFAHEETGRVFNIFAVPRKPAVIRAYRNTKNTGAPYRGEIEDWRR